MSISKIFIPVVSILLLLITFSCDENPVENENPANLEINLLVSEDGSGLVNIEATADHTEKFVLYRNELSEAIDSNNTGEFQITYIRTGNYTISIRAYGKNGRYIKKEASFIVSLENDVDPEDGYSTPLNYDGYTLLWNDEFSGNILNSQYWSYDIGNGDWGWGNNEKEYYLERNAYIENDLLVIEAKNETYAGFQYTSAKIKTIGKFSFQYGRVDIRALLPKGQGMWPALWMLGDNFNSVGWPACGEIDIMEMIGGSDRENEVHGTIHWDVNGHGSTGDAYSLSNGTFNDEFHVFTLIWNENMLEWYVNDNKFYEVAITESHMTEFHQKFWFILNLAVGGNWPGDPDGTTIFPQQLKVDYIRVFQKK